MDWSGENVETGEHEAAEIAIIKIIIAYTYRRLRRCSNFNSVTNRCESLI